MLTAHTLRHYPSSQAAAPDMARESVALLQRQIEHRGQASIVLTGGSSPGQLYEAWATTYRTAIDWSNVHFFWGDERNVPHDHTDSNVQTARPLLDRLPVDQANVHPWRTDLPIPAALQHMREVLAKADLGTQAQPFDLVLLGVGPDGHVASLFPAHAPWRTLPTSTDEVSFIDNSPKPPAQRYTFTLAALNHARCCYLMPFGEGKRPAIEGLLRGDPVLPVSYIRAAQVLLWTDIAL